MSSKCIDCVNDIQHFRFEKVWNSDGSNSSAYSGAALGMEGKSMPPTAGDFEMTARPGAQKTFHGFSP